MRDEQTPMALIPIAIHGGWVDQSIDFDLFWELKVLVCRALATWRLKFTLQAHE